MNSILSTATNAAYVLAIQVLALVTLPPVAFGSFSILYLLFAFSSSSSLSLISEAWIRTELRTGNRSSWEQYSPVSIYFAVTAGAVATVVCLLVEPLRPVAWLGPLAVSASVYRTTARYYSLRIAEDRGVFPADLAALVVTIGAWAAAYSFGMRDLWAMTMVWAVSSVVSAVLSKPPVLRGPSSLRRWSGEHGSQIRPLLRDSLLMDVGAIGTPYLLAPTLGLANFGVYRAVSNVAAPVRLVLNPVRPQLAAAAISSQRSLKRISSVIAVSFLFGIGAYIALLAVGSIDFYFGSLTDVVAFAVPTAIFVTANFFGQYYMIIARAHLDSRRLFAGRVIHTIVVIVFPIAGTLLYGLDGAIWGYVVSTALWAALWVFLVVRPPSTTPIAGNGTPTA